MGLTKEWPCEYQDRSFKIIQSEEQRTKMIEQKYQRLRYFWANIRYTNISLSLVWEGEKKNRIEQETRVEEIMTNWKQKVIFSVVGILNVQTWTVLTPDRMGTEHGLIAALFHRAASCLSGCRYRTYHKEAKFSGEINAFWPWARSLYFMKVHKQSLRES